MATLLSHQHQLQQSNQLLYNAPTTTTTNLININLTHSSSNHLHQGGHFCKDCGVMFESNTSLEVHLSYHKENLLTRWANQDALDKSSNSSSGSGSHYANPSSPSPNKRDISRSDNSSVESNSSSQYYHPVDTHYLPPLYNNNTGDQHMQSTFSTTPTYRSTPGTLNNNHGTSGFVLSQPPVDSSGPIMYEPFHTNFTPHGQQLPGGGHLLYSPNPGNHHSSGPPSSSDHTSQHHQVTRESAEILDLDSHKVHIYQHQQQQQQQQQQQSFFHRPYLPHLLPPIPPPGPPSTQPNGWPTESHFASRFSPATASGYTTLELPPNHFYTPAQPPPTTSAAPTNGIPPSTFEIVRMENPNYAPPTPQAFQQESSNGVGNGVPFGHRSPYLPPPKQQHQPPPTNVGVKREKSSPPGVTLKGQRSPPEGPTQAKNGQTPPVKTKGWKGGECKRPKTYNCPACNKWFTSSGHLKRHYGTTLHKNSMKQLGENAEELFKQQPKKKGAKSSSESKTPKQPKKARMMSSVEDSRDHDMMMRDEMSIKKESNASLLVYGNGTRGDMVVPVINNGPPQLNNDGELLKPFHAPISSPNNNNLFTYQPYGVPPPNHHHLLPPQQQPHHSPHLLPYAAPPSSAPTNQGNSGGSDYVIDFVPITPISVYNNGFQVQQPQGSNNVSEENGSEQHNNCPLPPFSSVGMSHYDGEMDPNFHNRVTPPYNHHHPGDGISQLTPSPHNNRNSVDNSGSGMNISSMGHRENSYERENKGGEGDKSSSYGGGGSRSEGSDGSMDGMLMDGSSPSGSEGQDGGGGGGSGELMARMSDGAASLRKDKPEVHECPLCSKTFNRSCYFKQHFKQQHSNTHSGGQLYKCPTCGKRFPEPDALSDHIAKHGSDKPYKCELCPKQFNHKTDLNRHRLLHTGDRPFVCDQCGKGFIRKDHMTKHSETHRKKSLAHLNSNSINNISPPLSN